MLIVIVTMQRGNYRKGFTIVELLIVIVVIAILAAIAIVSYTGIQNRARQSAAASAAEQAAKKVLSYATLNAENMPADLLTAGVANDANTTFEYTSDNSAKTYCITATFQGVSYYVSNTTAVATAGACAGHGVTAGQGDTNVKVSASSSNSCAIASTGKAYCWGTNNSDGIIGNGTTNTTNYTPTAVLDTVMTGTVSAIAVNVDNVCAIADGKAYCWGSSVYKKLGNGSTTFSTSPVAVTTSLMSGTVTDISGGFYHVCAIANKRVYCWGTNTYGSLGDGTNNDSAVPVAVDTSVMTGDVTDIDVGYGGATCAVADGKAYCWGYGAGGVLGNGSTANRNTPTAVNTTVMPAGTVTRVASGMSHSCGISAGKAYCWGTGTYGRLGDGTTNTSNTPVAVSTALMSGTVSMISAGYEQTCAVADGKAYCWGENTYGILGDGTATQRNTPTAVDTSLMTGTVTGISTKLNEHTCARTTNTVYCWGRGLYGRLGNGGTSTSYFPVQATPLP